ncbi:thiamine pyrophosphate-binding protein [Paenibacillus thalictri]|uniref:Thiamine pyrophosphate-binding protein n=1 Tax=Paenibacillus thalictri TaxID=2527873 RepID=A0A4Q9DXZ7_9BACL|nr:thiamine pyrophosphate-binding protein [Paenibacillus thalictri]TBL81276.1 thiamine pyrophosphate-binding protein [Paenibacillus thalictri]
MSVTTISPPQPVNAGKPQTSSHLNVAQFIIEQLRVWGVKTIYGVIGDATLFLLDELAKQNHIRYVPCRHEGAAALMASSEAKLTGRVAVCLATSGPGAANLLNGLADAYMDKAPVLVITGQVETGKIGTHAKQYVNQQLLLGTVCASSELLVSPDALPELLQTSLTMSLVQGTVTHISIPKNMYHAPVKGTVAPYGAHLSQRLLSPPEVVAQAASLLAGAERPVMMIGGGAAQAAEPIKQLAESLGAAVVTSYPARPLFPNDHELYAGGLGQGGSEASSTLLAESDLIAILGATWWPDEYTPARARIVQFDMSPAHIGVGHGLELGVVGDLTDIVPQLLHKAGLDKKDRSGWRARIAEVCGDWKKRIEREAGQMSSPLAPQHIVSCLSRLIAEDAIVCVDTGDHTLWFNRIFQAKRQQVLLSGRWRTLGFALPAAIAAQLEYPQRQVIAIAGDGGAVQTIMEFQTAVETGAPIVMLIFNNGSYAMEKNRMQLAGLQPLGSSIRNPDFAKLAEACGGVGMKATTPQELEQALTHVLSLRKPAIVEIATADTLVPHTKI